jgi:periplasmic divalent cation tolerance protein
MDPVHLQVVTAVDDAERAGEIARVLVDRRLAACVQVIGPIYSTYRWKGRVETEREHLLIVKTTSARYDECAAAIRELHAYETPEITATPIVAGDPDYLDWIGRGTEP